MCRTEEIQERGKEGTENSENDGCGVGKVIGTLLGNGGRSSVRYAVRLLLCRWPGTCSLEELCGHSWTANATHKRAVDESRKEAVAGIRRGM